MSKILNYYVLTEIKFLFIYQYYKIKNMSSLICFDPKKSDNNVIRIYDRGIKESIKMWNEPLESIFIKILFGIIKMSKKCEEKF